MCMCWDRGWVGFSVILVYVIIHPLDILEALRREPGQSED